MSAVDRPEGPVGLAVAGKLGHLDRSPGRARRAMAAESEGRRWQIATSAGEAGPEDPHGDVVREVQRMWILSALARLACEKPADSLTVREIIAHAGVSRRRFYELFENSTDCFEAAFEEAVLKAGEQVRAACGREGEWLERLRRGLHALLSFFDVEPELTRLCLLGTSAASPRMLARRREILADVAVFVDEGRGTIPAERQPPPLTAESLVGGALSVIQARILEPDHAPTVDLLNPLLAVLVLAYRGPQAARRELSRPMPRGTDRLQAGDARDSVALGMRLTYRTLRVLAVISASPGISNREVGEAAGVQNAGQISKMLARLERHGLIRNTGAGQSRGASNAWTLTPLGLKVDRAQRLARRGTQLG